MPIILVVDDSKVDQKLVAGLIKQDIEWMVEFADDGESALDLMDTIFPDVVITDLMMPKMDGFELVRKAKQKFPQIPVILVTGKGSETLAIEALHAGAASYVPKSALADSLMDTLEQILHMAEKAKSQDRLRKCMTSSRYQFKLTNDPDLIWPLISFVNEMMTNHEYGDEALRRQARVVLEEALINAMFHGNLELAPSEARAARLDMHLGKIGELVQEKRQEEPFSQRRILIGVDLKPPITQFIVRDEGPGFDVSKLPAVEDLDNISSPDIGRGLTLVGHLADQVEFNEAGNEIKIVFSGNAKAAKS